MKLDTALKLLLKERKRLQEGQGRIARVNARRRFRAACRKVGAAFEKDYPRIKIEREPETLYVIEVFEPRHREGRRLLNDRWRRIRSQDPVGSRFKRAHLAHPLKRASFIAVGLQRLWHEKLFRIRVAGGKQTVMAGMLR